MQSVIKSVWLHLLLLVVKCLILRMSALIKSRHLLRIKPPSTAKLKRENSRLCLALHVNAEPHSVRPSRLFTSPSINTLKAQLKVHCNTVGMHPNWLAPAEPALLSPVARRIEMLEALQVTIGTPWHPARIQSQRAGEWTAVTGSPPASFYPKAMWNPHPFEESIALQLSKAMLMYLWAPPFLSSSKR